MLNELRAIQDNDPRRTCPLVYENVITLVDFLGAPVPLYITMCRSLEVRNILRVI